MLLNGEPKPISDAVKMISFYRKKKIPYSNVKNSYRTLYKEGYIDYCEGNYQNHKYIKITQKGISEYRKIEKEFIEEYCFMSRVYNEAVIDK